MGTALHAAVFSQIIRQRLPQGKVTLGVAVGQQLRGGVQQFLLQPRPGAEGEQPRVHAPGGQVVPHRRFRRGGLRHGRGGRRVPCIRPDLRQRQIFLYIKSRCAPGRQGSPRQPASGRRCPQCLPRPTARPPAAACRASGCRRAGPRCASLRPDCGTAVRTAAPPEPGSSAVVKWTMIVSSSFCRMPNWPHKKLYSGYFHEVSSAYNRSIPAGHPNVK